MIEQFSLSMFLKILPYFPSTNQLKISTIRHNDLITCPKGYAIDPTQFKEYLASVLVIFVVEGLHKHNATALKPGFGWLSETQRTFWGCKLNP